MSQVSEAIAEGRLSERLWFYANYVCNLTCVYCLTESAPNVPARELDAGLMRSLAKEGAGLGFASIGVTGGEPFMRRDMVEVLSDLADTLPTIVLSNGTLFSGARLRALEPLASKPFRIQMSLDAARPQANDEIRGPENFRKVIESVPRLVGMGIGIRIATTLQYQDEEELAELCALHRSLGVSDEDHVVRGIVKRGRALTEGLGEDAGIAELAPELTITTDGAFWSPFGPTIVGGRLDQDLMVARGIRALRPAAEALVGLIEDTAYEGPTDDRFT